MLIAARAVRTNVLRATFDTAPRALDPSGYGDALNPRNWSLSRATGSGYAPIPVRVDALAATTSFDVTVLCALDADVDYALTAAPTIEAAP